MLLDVLFDFFHSCLIRPLVSDIFHETKKTAFCRSDLAYLDSLTTAILHVTLVKPRVGVFQEHIHYLLCIATALEVVLLAVSFSDQNGWFMPFLCFWK